VSQLVSRGVRRTLIAYSSPTPSAPPPDVFWF
jgi:hypothetical protein